jgi:tRNA (guanine37-N1)-methyltransferase
MTSPPQKAPFAVTVLTIMPEMFPGPLGASLAGRALESGRWSLDVRDIREHALDRHRSVDDTPFGGGAGMVMRADVLERALLAVPERGRLLYMSPRGRVLNQALVRELAALPKLTLLCGRFEGVDQRVLDAYGFEDVSLGDYVLSGGELAAMTLIDACVRLLPGVLGNEATIVQESFENGLLEYSHYTRPARWEDAQGRVWSVPEVLASGHHEKVATWRHAEAERITRERRPDLWGIYAMRSKYRVN